MVLNLIRLSNDLGSSLSVDVLIFSVHKNPVGRLVEFVTEHSCVLVIFGIKNSAYLSFSVFISPGFFSMNI